MRKLLMLILAAVGLGGGGFYYANRDAIKSPGDFFEVASTSLQSFGASTSGQRGLPPVNRSGETIRVASFNVQVLGPTKFGKPHVMDYLARIVRQFDVVAIQEIRTEDQSVIPQFIDLINQTGRHYDYVIGPRLGRTHSKEQYAFIFDTASLEVDRNQTYTVSDPEDLFHREPLVGWFRVRGPDPEAAFTFSLVNLHVDPDEVSEEVRWLPELVRVIRDDGRQEDDVLLVGDFNAGDQEFQQLMSGSKLDWVLSFVPTNTRATAQYDNILFEPAAVTEFTGRAGVYDFLRDYNLTQEEALEVSDHMPIWAEFSIYEGGVPGHVANTVGLPEPAQSTLGIANPGAFNQPVNPPLPQGQGPTQQVFPNQAWPGYQGQAATPIPQ